MAPCLQADVGVVAVGDLAHDGQAQAAAVAARIEQPVEPLEDQFRMVRRDAGAVVLDTQQHMIAVGLNADGNA